jgi:DNA-binding NtrC family response regulator
MTSFSDLNALIRRRRGSQAPPAMHPVVVIDDDPHIRDGLAVLFGDRYQLTLCASPVEGVDAVSPDTCAVVLDIQMPEHDGFWTCDEIRKKAPDVPVIFYSAYQNLKDPYAVINDHRPFGYVAKGDDVQKLVNILETAVKLQSMSIANRKLIENLEKARNHVR